MLIYTFQNFKCMGKNKRQAIYSTYTITIDNFLNINIIEVY